MNTPPNHLAHTNRDLFPHSVLRARNFRWVGGLFLGMCIFYVFLFVTNGG